MVTTILIFMHLNLWFGAAGVAQVRSRSLKELQSFYDLKALRGPEAAYELADRIFRQGVAENDLSKQIQSLSYFILDERDESEYAVLQIPYSELEQKLKKLQDPIAELLLDISLRLRAMAQERNPQPDAFRSLYLEAIDRAMALRAPLLVLYFNENLSFWEHNRGEYENAILHCQKALSFVGHQLEEDDNFVLSTRNTIAMLLDFKGDSEQSDRIYAEVLQRLRKKGVTFGIASVSHNYAQSLARRHKLPAAALAYQETLQLSQVLSNALLQAVALKGLAFVRFLEQKYQESNLLLEQALAIFEKLPHAEVGVADVWRKKAENDLGLQKPLDALQAADRASLPEAVEDKSFLLDLEDIRARAYHQLRLDNKAYEAQLRAKKLQQEVVEQERNNDLNRLKVNLGLTIEEQKNHILAQQNAMQRERIKQSEQERWLLLGLTFLSLSLIIAAAHMYRQHQEIQHTHQELRYVLNSIEEGIVSINQRMKIETQISPYLDAILKEEDRAVPYEDLLARLIRLSHLPQSEQTQIYNVLQAVLGEDLSTWELNVEALPKELSLMHSHRTLGLTWQPICTDKDQVTLIVLCVRDITETKKLNQSVKVLQDSVKRKNTHIIQLLNLAPSQWSHLQTELDHFAKSLQIAAETGRNHAELRKNLHTLKGLARSMQFQEIVLETHQLEDLITQGTVEIEGQARQKLQLLVQLIAEYSQILKEFQQGTNQRLHSQILGEILAEPLHEFIKNLRHEGFELGRLVLEDSFQDWSPEAKEFVRALTLHALNNCLDHGFVLPRLRLWSVPKVIQLVIVARRNGDHLQFTFSDNGYGLDVNSLREKAQQKGIVDRSDDQLYELLLQGGLSTATLVTERSGRGLGLSAMASLCQAAQGELHIRPDEIMGGTKVIASFYQSARKSAEVA